jgi:hypothetical protein
MCPPLGGPRIPSGSHPTQQLTLDLSELVLKERAPKLGEWNFGIPSGRGMDDAVQVDFWHVNNLGKHRYAIATI